MSDHTIAISPLVVAVLLDTLIGSLKVADRPDGAVFHYPRETRQQVLEGLGRAFGDATIYIVVDKEARE